MTSASSSSVFRSCVRWVGFDMDDCVGNVMPAAGFVSKFGPETVAHTLYPFEITGETWLLRPGFSRVVEAVAKAYKNNQIEGAFLYSNNTSSKTVEFAKHLLNKIASETVGVTPFRAAFHRGAAARSSESDKRFEDVCNLLHVADLVPPTSSNDILFYDDQFHPLATEIAHYVRVPKYGIRMPYKNMNAAMESLLPTDPVMFNRVAIYTAIMEDEVLPESILPDCPPVDDTVIDHFLQGLERFLDTAPAAILSEKKDLPS
jgi:hypothetical protein